jgi:hypothetical protein
MSARLPCLLAVTITVLAPTAYAQRIQPPLAASAADVEVWSAALEQVKRETQQPLAFIRETLPAAEFLGRVSKITQERVLVAKLLTRNQASLSVPLMTLAPAMELLDLVSIQKAGSVEVDWEIVRTRFTLRGMRLVRLSLPAFSDDGTRALVEIWTTGGFNDGRGGTWVFQKNNGSWTSVNYLRSWIS